MSLSVYANDTDCLRSLLYIRVVRAGRGRALIQYGHPLAQLAPDLFPAAWVSTTTLRWAYSVLSSRGFPSRLAAVRDPDADRVGCLLPMADYFNHCLAGASTVQNWHVTETSVQFRSLAHSGFNVQAGEQLYTNYGAKSNEEFLLGYGFTVCANPYDHVTLKLSRPDPEQPHAELQADWLLDLSTVHYLQRRNVLPATLVHSAYISMMTPLEAYMQPVQLDPDHWMNSCTERTVYETLFMLLGRQRDHLPTIEGIEDENSRLYTSSQLENVRNYVQGQYEVLSASIAALQEHLGVFKVVPNGEDLLRHLEFDPDGVLTRRALQREDVIARIPHSDLVVPTPDGDWAEFGPEFDLAVFLLERWVANDPAAMSLLTPNSTLLWSLVDLQRLGPEHSSAVGQTQERLADAELAFDGVHERLGTAMEFGAFLRALATAQAHLVTLPDGTATLPLTLPSLPAHSVTPNAAFVGTPDALLLVAIAKIGDGEAVTVSRGRALTNADLLVQYGQVLDANPFDMIELDVPASVAFAEDPDSVDICCVDMPEMVHSLVWGCPNGIPERLFRDLGRVPLLALVRHAWDVLYLERPDPSCVRPSPSFVTDSVSSISDLIVRYRAQCSLLLYRAESWLSLPSSSTV